METNGTLRTATQFEYQNYKSLSIRVRASDEGNLSVEKSFTVLILESPDFSELPKSLKIQLNESVAIDFILVEAGTFQMGSTEINGKALTVQLTKPYYLAKYELTLLQYTVARDDSYIHDESRGETFWNQPKVNLNYISQVIPLIDELNTKHQSTIPDGWSFALPTEAQWENACTSGVKIYKNGVWLPAPYSTGETITKTDANFGGGVGAQTKTVGYYPPNAWGFFDMHGNVAELTSTYYHSYNTYEETFVVDPIGPETGNDFVQRGGHWNSHADWLTRTDYRLFAASADRWGVRLSIQKE
jgi:formylglycine-generating enzyme required for sulfatase activity